MRKKSLRKLGQAELDALFDSTHLEELPMLVGQLREDLPAEEAISQLWHQYFRCPRDWNPFCDREFLIIDQIPNSLTQLPEAGESLRHAEPLLMDCNVPVDIRLVAIRILAPRRALTSPDQIAAIKLLRSQTRPDLWEHILGCVSSTEQFSENWVEPFVGLTPTNL